MKTKLKNLLLNTITDMLYAGKKLRPYVLEAVSIAAVACYMLVPIAIIKSNRVTFALLCCGMLQTVVLMAARTRGGES